MERFGTVLNDSGLKRIGIGSKESEFKQRIATGQPCGEAGKGSAGRAEFGKQKQ